MKEQFVTYEIALKLKDLGFNEECIGMYDKDKNLKHVSDWDHCNSQEKCEYIFGKGFIQAPLWQQAISFLLNYISKEDNLYLINCSFYSDNSGFIRGNNYIKIPFDNLENCILILLTDIYIYARSININ